MPEKMKRTQIYLEPELDEDLSRLAARRGVSKAQLLREGAYRIVREDRAAEEDSIHTNRLSAISYQLSAISH